MKKTAVIILPTYNEAKNITHIIDRLYNVAEKISNWEIHVVIVDSDSPDGTGKIVSEIKSSHPKKYRNLHIVQTEKEGLGRAYIRGFETALKKLNPYVLFEMDADLSHDPQAIPEFLSRVEKGADFVIGSRYRKGGSIPSDWAFKRKAFSILGNLIIRLGFMKIRITDWTSGYRAMKAWVIKKNLPKISDYTGYVFQVALLDNAVISRAHIDEVPIVFKDRKEGVSKIDSFEYILQTLWYVATKSSFIKFCIVGGTGFIVDFGFAYTFIHFLHLPKVLSNMLSAEVAIISNFMLNNYWSFAHKKIGESGSLLKSLLKFNLVSSGSIIIQGVGMWLALKLLGDHILHIGAIEYHSWIIYKIVIILLVIIPYSYIFYNKFIWKEK